MAKIQIEETKITIYTSKGKFIQPMCAVIKVLYSQEG